MSAFRGMRFWVGLSVALHLAALLFLILDVLPRRIPEPEDIAIPVELIIPMPTQQARGDVAAPRPAPDQVPAPPRPDQAAEPQRPQPVAPPPPPPPPPPAPAQAAAPPQQCAPSCWPPLPRLWETSGRPVAQLSWAHPTREVRVVPCLPTTRAPTRRLSRTGQPSARSAYPAATPHCEVIQVASTVAWLGMRTAEVVLFPPAPLPRT